MVGSTGKFTRNPSSLLMYSVHSCAAAAAGRVRIVATMNAVTRMCTPPGRVNTATSKPKSQIQIQMLDSAHDLEAHSLSDATRPRTAAGGGAGRPFAPRHSWQHDARRRL